MKKLEKLVNFKISDNNRRNLTGGQEVQIRTYTDCSTYTYNTANELCDSTTTRTGDDGSKSTWTINNCTA